MPLEIQVKLLRVIQFGEFQMLRSPETKKVTVRSIAATNSDLSKALTDGVFRSDLHSPGCIQSELRKSKDPFKFKVAEIWRRKSDFDSYVNSTLFKHLLSAMEISSEKPEIQISECDNIRGIELIEEVMKTFGNYT